MWEIKKSQDDTENNIEDGEGGGQTVVILARQSLQGNRRKKMVLVQIGPWALNTQWVEGNRAALCARDNLTAASGANMRFGVFN